MYGANKKRRAPLPENKFGTARMQEQAKEERNKRLREKALAHFKANNPIPPTGTTVGKNKVGQDVSYRPGRRPLAEGPSSLTLNKKGIMNTKKVARLGEKINKVGKKLDTVNKSDKKFNRLTKKSAKLTTKRSKYFE